MSPCWDNDVPLAGTSKYAVWRNFGDQIFLTLRLDAMEARLEVVVAALRSGGGPFSGFKVPLEAPVSDGGLHAAREEAPKMLRRTGGGGWCGRFSILVV